MDNRKLLCFADELKDLINRHSMENGSDTPDFILANYIGRCLGAWEMATRARDEWYGFEPWPSPPYPHKGAKDG